jgi:hypothetical protein
MTRIAPSPPRLDLEQLTFPKLFGVDVIGVIAVQIPAIVVLSRALLQCAVSVCLK